MTIDALDTELKNGILKPIYVFYGEETYLLENAVNKIKKLFGEKIDGINYILLDESNANNLIGEMSTPAFGYEKKLIIVKRPELLKRGSKLKDLQEKLIDYIEKNIDYVRQNIVLIFIEDKVDKLKISTTLEKYGEMCNFERLKPVQLAKKMKTICSQYNVNIDEKDVLYLIDISGTSMQSLINEMRKLIEFAGNGGTITKDSIDKLAIPQIEGVIFNLTDELGVKNISKALETLNNLLYQKEPIQMILIILYRHFKKLYLVKLASSEERQVQEVLELKPNQLFLVSKYKKQAEYFSQKALEQILTSFIDLDQKSKMGLLDLEVGVEAILCSNF